MLPRKWPEAHEFGWETQSGDGQEGQKQHSNDILWCTTMAARESPALSRGSRLSPAQLEPWAVSPLGGQGTEPMDREGRVPQHVVMSRSQSRILATAVGMGAKRLRRQALLIAASFFFFFLLVHHCCKALKSFLSALWKPVLQPIAGICWNRYTSNICVFARSVQVQIFWFISEDHCGWWPISQDADGHFIPK